MAISRYNADNRFCIIQRLIIFLLSFYIAMTPTFLYAFSGNPLDFKELKNFVRTAGGATAEYFFKDYAGTTYSSSHGVTNRQLAGVSFKRILGKVGWVGAAYTVAELTNLILNDGWIIDKDAEQIYKTTGGMEYRYAELIVNHPSLLSNRICGKCPYAETNAVLEDQMIRFAKKSWKDQSLKYGNSHYVISYRINPDARKIMTETEMEEYINQSSNPQVEALMRSGDYLKEPHAPTIAAAEKAAPSKPRNCPSGTVYDPVNKTCLGSDNGVKPKPNPEDGYELPPFCAWAMPVCDFIEWIQTDEDLPENPVIDKETVDLSDLPQSVQIDFNDNCPSDATMSFTIITTVDISMSYQPVCVFMQTVRPFIIASGYIYGIFIFINAVRD